MIMRYGMSEQLGLATCEAPRKAMFLDLSADGEKEYSEATARQIDGEMRKLLERGHERVRDTLTQRRAVLEALAKLLMAREVVDRKELGQLLEGQPV